jgi:hypothetical protein
MRRLEIRSHLAYADHGLPAEIPAGALLTMEFTILDAMRLVALDGAVPSRIGLPNPAYDLVTLIWLHGRAGWQDLLSPQERSDSPRDRPNCVGRWTRWLGVWIVAPRRPRR